MDRDLLRAAKAGDSTALNTVSRWIFAELMPFFRTHVAEEIADELVQRTAAEVFSMDFAGRAPEDPVVFRSWLRGCARNIERRWWREVGRYSEVLGELEDQRHLPARGPETELSEQEERAIIDAAIDQLDSPYRSTLRLFNECEDAPKVAATLGVAQSTVRWRLMVARNQLRQLVPRSPQAAERAAS